MTARLETTLPEFEAASRLLLRRISAVSERMAAAEPGTDDFLAAYVEARDLKRRYLEVRGRWQAPAGVFAEILEPLTGHAA